MPGKPIQGDMVGKPDCVLFKVRNEARAIPEQTLETPFTSLVQLPEGAGDMRPYSSLGLGRFIAKQIAVAHGGDITVTSGDAATVFVVQIPRAAHAPLRTV